LYTDSKRIEITFSNTARSHDADCSEPSVYEQHEGGDDSARENPFRNSDWDLGLNLTGPFVECEQIDGCKSIDAIDCDGNKAEDPNHEIREAGKTGAAFEVIEILMEQDVSIIPKALTFKMIFITHDVIPCLLELDLTDLLPISTARHFVWTGQIGLYSQKKNEI
jgi:hypothetical protein